MRKLLITLTVGLALGIGTARASAESLDLTIAGASGDLVGSTGGTALFIQGEFNCGTGACPAFVQIDNLGTTTTGQAYNTTVTMNGPLNSNGSSPTHNHEITVAQLQVTTIGGVPYYGFLLDVNENSGCAGGVCDQFISLDEIVLGTSTVANDSDQPLPVPLTIRWDMAGDKLTGDNILLDYDLESGSGFSDMTFFVPVSAFAGALSTDFVYLFSAFGNLGIVPLPGDDRNYGMSDGFEEWALRPGTPVIVPDGGITALMLGLSLLGLGFRARRKQ